ncbi:zinc transporter [Pseudoscourfieldia marina]
MFSSSSSSSSAASSAGGGFRLTPARASPAMHYALCMPVSSSSSPSESAVFVWGEAPVLSQANHLKDHGTVGMCARKGAPPVSTSTASVAQPSSTASSQGVLERKLVVALALSIASCAGEGTFGIAAGSLAILTDSAHMLSDALAYAIALAAVRIARRPATADHNEGLLRAEVLGSLASVTLTWFVTASLVAEATRRLAFGSNGVHGRMMCITAICAFVVNLVLVIWFHDAMHARPGGHDENCPCSTVSTLLKPSSAAAVLDVERAEEHDDDDDDDDDDDHESLLRSRKTSSSNVDETDDDSAIEVDIDAAREDTSDAEKKEKRPKRLPFRKRVGAIRRARKVTSTKPAATAHNLNMRAAYVHVIGDLLHTFGVAVVGAVIWAHPRLHVIDPICTFVFAGIVVATTVPITRDIVDVLMHRAPRDVDVAKLAKDLGSLPGVAEVGMLRAWSRTPGKPVLTAHVRCVRGAKASHVLAACTSECTKAGITDTTLQVVEVSGGGGGGRGGVSPSASMQGLLDAPRRHNKGSSSSSSSSSSSLVRGDAHKMIQMCRVEV